MPKQKLPPQADQSKTEKHIFKQTIKLGVFLTLSVFAFLSYTYFTQAQIPNFVNYQGRLRDNTGNPITAPTTIQFSLYSHITNGAPTDVPGAVGPLLWTETYDGSGGCAQITPGTDGIFAQHLGDCVSFPAYLDFTQEYYLGVKIGADAEATPRVPLSTHPYAFTAKRLNVRDENVYITSENSGDIVLQAADDILLYDANNDLGLAGEILSSTGSGIDWISPSSFSAGSLWDLDHDTGVQIEEGADDDTLRIDTAGSQRMAIDNTGNLLLSDTEPASFINPGNSQGLLFRDDKFALRVGEANNNEWDDVNVGRGSFASGRNNIVSGNYSTAFGGSNNINDVYATALGRNNTVTGSYAVAGGFQNTANGYASAVFGQTNQVTDRRAMAWGLDNIASQDEATAWGRNTRASANYATSWGRDTQASGNYSTAFGYQNIASDDYGLAFGYRNTVSGRYATGWGGQNTASGQYSTTWGSHNTASGAHSTAFGYYSEASAENGTAIGDSLANSNYMTAIGRFNENVAGQSLTNWVDTDQLFVIGNGSGWQDANRSNALTILKNGTITAPTFSLAEINTAGNTALTTKEYVDGAILSGTNNIYANNGALTGDRTLTGAGNGLTFTGLSEFLVDLTSGAEQATLQMASDEVFASTTDGVTNADYRVDASGINLTASNIGAATANKLYIGSASMLITDEANSKGIDYAADYSANYTNRTLVDKEYVDTSIAAGNIYGTDGTLTGNRIVDFDDKRLTFSGSLFGADSEFYADGQTIKSSSTRFDLLANEINTGYSLITASGATFGHINNDGSGDKLSYFNANKVGLKIVDEIIERGVEYDADYSANYTNRTLVDKEYVDNAITGGANNIYTNDGTLAGNRIVTMGTNNLQFDSAGQTGLLFMDNTNDRIGIGTTSPAYSLHLMAEDKPATVEDLIKVELNGASGDYWSISNSTTSNGVFAPLFIGETVNNSTRTPLVFSGRTDAAGDVGTDSMMTFDVRRNTPAPISNRTLFRWTSHADEIMRVDNNRRLGIGEASPLTRLHINSNDANTAGILTLENTAGDIQMFRTDANPESSVTGSIGDFAFDGTNGEVYIKNSGNTTNTGWLRMLNVADNILLSDADSDTFLWAESALNADEDYLVAQANHTGTGTLQEWRDGGGTTRLTVNGNGDLTTNGAIRLGASEYATISRTNGVGSTIKPIRYSALDSAGGWLAGHQFEINGTPIIMIPENGNVVLDDIDISAANSSRADSKLYVGAGAGTKALHLYGDTPAVGSGPELNFGTWYEGGVPRYSARMRAVRVDNTYRTNMIIGTSDSAQNNIIDFAYFMHNQRLGLGNSTPSSVLHVDSNDANTAGILTLENTAGDIQMFRTDANPESSVTGSIGDLAIDGTNGNAYIKHSGNGTNTGWLQLATGSGSSPWSKTGTNLSPTTAGDDVLLNAGETLSISEMTQGSVPFIGASGLVTQDNSNLFWDDANDRLGIGTTSPSYSLAVVGAGSGTDGSLELATYANAGAPSGLYLHRSGGTEATPTAITSSMPMGGVMTGGYDGTSMVAYSAGMQMDATENWSNSAHGTRLFFSTTANGTTGMSNKMVIDNNGYVGIGSSVTPNALLDVRGNAVFNDDAGDYDFRVEGDTDQNLFFTDAGNNRIGIGTATPSVKLQVSGQARASSFRSANGTAGSPSYRFDGDTNTGLFRAAADNLAFTTGGSEAVRIDAGGNLGVGITIPTAQLHTTGTVRFANFGAGTLVTDANGNVSVSSDERLKNIQGTFDRGLSELMGINPIEYKWKKETGYDTENSYYGFSAQNIKLSIPEAVGEDGRGYLTLSDRPILATAINAIKEQQIQIEESKLKIETNTLKTDTNIKTLAELQKSVDDNLVIINQSLVTSSEEQEEGHKKINQTIKTNKENIAENTASLATLSENINSLTELTTTLTDTVADHEDKITKIETILAEGGVDLNNNNIELPEVLKTFVDNLEVLEEDGKDIEFTLEGKLIVKEIKTDKLLVSKDAVFEGNVIYTSKDMAGKAVIKEGEKKVEVKFEKEFEEIPYITAVVNNEFILYQVTNVSTEGFEIRTKDEVTKDIEFTWQAIIVKD